MQVCLSGDRVGVGDGSTPGMDCLSVATRNRLSPYRRARVNQGDGIRRSFLVLFTARICDVPVFPGVADTCDACR